MLIAEAPFLDARVQQRRTGMSAQGVPVPRRGGANGANTVAEVSAPLPAAAARANRCSKTSCSACHSLDSADNEVGPSLKGVIRRRVGSIDFAYSDAGGEREVWTGRRIVDFASQGPVTHAPARPVKPSGSQARRPAGP
jgi:cytochrome c2